MKFTEARDFIIEKLVDELDPDLTYHNIDHTLDVLNAAGNLAELEKISTHDRALLETAALFHDSGMLTTYIGHEEASVDIARKYLPDFGYDKKDIDIISDMIITTKLPQSATTYLEKILCDADLDYMGREDFFMIAHQLRYEWNILNIRYTTLRDWYELQIMFLENHNFFTPSSRRLRNEKKANNLEQVKELVCFMNRR
ncbi:MAG: HD domain-containing protein [Bacteroidales bacterium]|nr:HD domain-containing protein [Bacteroidales bacterium]